MRKLILGLIAGSSALVSAQSQAQTRPGFEIGAEVFDYSYRERFEGDVVARDDGTFGGGTFGYVETIGGGMFLRAKLAVDFGSVDYRSEDGRIDNVNQSIGQLELHLGKDFALGNGGTLTPFIGLASRVLEDHSGNKETELGFAGYDREVSYAYVPVGAAATFPLGGRSELILSAQYNWVVGGEAKSKFSDLDPDLPDLKLDLENGSGFEASAIARFKLGGNAIGFGPFVRRWSIDQSKELVLKDPDGSGDTITLFEPKNRTTEVGVRLTFAF